VGYWPTTQSIDMTATAGIALPDIQAWSDYRGTSIDAVGIKGLRYPLTISSGGRSLPTIATLSMTVGLSAVTKGTHMSRFIELLETQSKPLEQRDFKRMVFDMLARLRAPHGTIEIQFPYFVTKAVPVSGVQSRLDYEVRWVGAVTADGVYSFAMQVLVPATSLCPCSKEISKYGAHNQRTHISIRASLASEMAIEELIKIAERCASCELYGLLKRQDEKYVTERAYENPKFVEDLVRDVALALCGDHRVSSFLVEAENSESIHNHSAFARIIRSPADVRENRPRTGHGTNFPVLVAASRS
jgi:GTP cyclohydrolase IB